MVKDQYISVFFFWRLPLWNKVNSQSPVITNKTFSLWWKIWNRNFFLSFRVSSALSALIIPQIKMWLWPCYIDFPCPTFQTSNVTTYFDDPKSPHNIQFCLCGECFKGFSAKMTHTQMTNFWNCIHINGNDSWPRSKILWICN